MVSTIGMSDLVHLNGCSKRCQWLVFGVYTVSLCQLANSFSSSSSSSEFRNAPYAQLFIDNIGSVDFVVDRKSLQTNMTYCNNQLKDKVKLAVVKQEYLKERYRKIAANH